MREQRVPTPPDESGRPVTGTVRVGGAREPSSTPRTTREYNENPRRKSTDPRYRKRASSLEKKKAKGGWLFVIPFVLGFIIVYLPIIYKSILFSFTKITPLMGGGYSMTWMGFENYYNALFVDSSYVATLSEGIKQLVFDIPAIVVFSLFMAILLNQKMVGRAAFRAIFFLPVILSTGLIESIDADNKLLDYMGSSGGNDMGDRATNIVSSMDIEKLLSSMSLGEEVIAKVVDFVNNIYDIVNRSGVQMLIFLAGLQSISPAIYESCQIEGATAWETFWKITFPMITPMILVNSIYTIIDEFTCTSNSVMQYISDIFASSSSSGTGGREVSSAMAWMYFLIVLAIVGIASAIIGSFVFYQRRDN